MSRIAFLTEALRRAQPAPPSRSSAGCDALDARVLLDEVEPLDREQQRLLLGVPDLHELALFPLDRNALQAPEEADAVVAVDDRVAELQVAQVGEERLGGPAARDRRAPLLAEDLALGVDREARLAQAEAGGDLGGDADDGARRAARRRRGASTRARSAGASRRLRSAAPRRRLPRPTSSARVRSPPRPPRCGRRAPAIGLGRQPQRDRPVAARPEPVEEERRRLEALADPLDGMQRAPPGAKKSRSGSRSAGDALGESRRSPPRRRGLDDDEQRAAPRDRASRPASARHGRSEDDALGLRGRPADPLGQERRASSDSSDAANGGISATLEPLARALRVGIEDAQRRDAVAVELDAHGRSRSGGKTSKRPPRTARSPVSIDEVGAAVADARQALDDARQRDLLALVERARRAPRSRSGAGSRVKSDRAGRTAASDASAAARARRGARTRRAAPSATAECAGTA